MRLLEEIGDKLANVVEGFQSKQSLRDRDRDRYNSRSRDNYRNRSRERRESRDNSRYRDRDRDIGRGRDRSNSRDGRRNKPRSGTGQRYFDKNEYCNYCDKTGHTTHRCHKLENYLKRKGKKIISHEEEDVQELAQAVQDWAQKSKA